jgi:hypothetical protein
VLYQPSMYSKTARRSPTLVRHGRALMSSRLSVAKNDSATASSQHSPLRPTESTTPLARPGPARPSSAKSRLAY